MAENIQEKMIESTSGGGQLEYMPYKSGVSIKRYQGIEEKIDIPGYIGGKPVIAIERKAFLSCKSIRRITLPNTIEEIGDWAFAHAEHLKMITVPYHALTRGKELFLGCVRLKEISVDAHADFDELGLSRMTAIAVTALRDYFLFAPLEIGSDEWVRRFDAKLFDLIRLDDLDGFMELWTCGEEDYEGKDYDIKSYPVEKRKMKLRIVFFRLLHPYKLSEQMKNEFMDYIKASDEAWEIIIQEHKEELEYYKLFAASGGITEENFDALLCDLADGGAEIKAYLLKYKEESFERKDAFSGFELDW